MKEIIAKVGHTQLWLINATEAYVTVYAALWMIFQRFSIDRLGIFIITDIGAMF